MKSELTKEEKILDSFGAKLKDTNTEFYDSKFIKIYNVLKRHYKISQVLKAGSFGKETKIELHGDMDITFTIDKPKITDVKEIREDLEEKLKGLNPKSYPKLKYVAVLIEYKNDFSIDVVYLSKEDFEKEKKKFKHIKTINDQIKNIIRLVKYWNYNKNEAKTKNYEIELNAINSDAGTYRKRLRDTINKSGGIGNVDDIYDYLYKEAGGIKIK